MSDPYVPKPPTDAEVKRISEQQKYIHDDWTGEGGGETAQVPTDDKAEAGKKGDRNNG